MYCILRMRDHSTNPVLFFLFLNFGAFFATGSPVEVIFLSY